MKPLLFPLVLASLAAYALGSLSFAVLVSRAFGLPDPRHYGSRNPGATNVLRSGNKVAAALTLVLDAFKGWLAVFALGYFGPMYYPTGSAGAWAVAQACVALAVFMGHLYPVFWGFQGGKGVATAAGVLLGIHPLLGLAALATWVAVAVVTRYASLAAMLSALLAPVYYWYGGGYVSFGGGAARMGSFTNASAGPAGQPHPAIGAAITAMALLLLWRHRANLRRLWRGQEGRIGQGQSKA